MILFGLFTPTVLLIQVISANTPNEYSDNSSLDMSSLLCRTEKGILLPFHIYQIDTCASCYNYLPNWAFADINLKFSYDPFFGALKDPRTNISYLIDPDNLSHPIFHTFGDNFYAVKWMACCRAAIACCESILRDPPFPHDKLCCPRTWDGWQCWPDTPAGEIAESTCQDHIYFESEPPACTRYATKSCTENGTWYIHEKFQVEWTNYSGCGRIENLRRLQYFHIATYAISAFFLIPAIIIFAIYKQLQVNRITMHKNLFSSLLLNETFAILFKSVVMLYELDNFNKTETFLERNGPGCKFLFILTKYFRMSNYMWMFCEGLYLRRLIAAAFSEQKSMLLFYLIGWVFPLIPVMIYAVLRELFANEKCWAMPASFYEWILNTPNLLSLVLNFAFLCQIIQVLMTKLRAAHANEPSQYRYLLGRGFCRNQWELGLSIETEVSVAVGCAASGSLIICALPIATHTVLWFLPLKAVRATFILVPLFGLHFALVVYRPQSGDCKLSEAYSFFTYTLDGLQGLLVALMFCYLNEEIQTLLWRSIQRYRLQHKFPSASDWKHSTRSDHRMS